MKATVARDSQGFWAAYFEEETHTPDGRRFGTVLYRRTLPVPYSATREQAEAALARIVSEEARRGDGLR